ncbi:MAG: hypothetical protein LBD11_02755 [Candidatus Peribacteria bacterium]|jgi:RNA-binding protein YlmH|nr:hypothetical protein [Candidatus Peribacteria bacterium]
MHILHYLQTTKQLSRRAIVDLIKKGQILVNKEKIESFKHELAPGDEIILP